MYVRPHNRQTELLEAGAAFVATAKGTPRGDEAALRIKTARPTPKGWLVGFQGIGDRDAAAALTNHKLFVRRGELPDIDDDEIYFSDLIGCSATDANGRLIGTIRAFFDNGAHEVCVLRTPDGAEALVPFHEETLVELGDKVVLDLPDGIPGLDD